MKEKRAAMELSIGTIVIIVLAMTMLILGLILVKNIFSGSTKVIDMTEEQLTNQIRDLFGDDRELAIFPASKLIEVKQGEVDGFGIGIKNRGNSGVFSYEVVVSDPQLQSNCGVSEKQVVDWIEAGKSEDNIELGPGDDTVAIVRLRVAESSAICLFRLRINVKKDGTPYASDSIDVEIKA